MRDSNLPGESGLSGGQSAQTCPTRPRTTVPRDPQIPGKRTGPEPPQDSAWVGGPLFPGGSWDLEIQGLCKGSRSAASEVEWPGLWSQC